MIAIDLLYLGLLLAFFLVCGHYANGCEKL